MTTQLQALERVCDKRHARMMADGKTEKEAADLIVMYLQGWLKRHAEYISTNSVCFVQSLLEGYSV